MRGMNTSTRKSLPRLTVRVYSHSVPMQGTRMSADAATTSSVNPLALMGDSETVLNVIGHMTEEDNAFHGQISMTHLGASGEYSSTKRPRKCPKCVSQIILFAAIVTAGVIMTFPLILFYANSNEVRLITHIRDSTY